MRWLLCVTGFTTRPAPFLLEKLIAKTYLNMYRNMMTTMMESFTKRTTSVKHAKLLSQPVPNIALFVTFVYPSSIITAYGNVLFHLGSDNVWGRKTISTLLAFCFCIPFGLGTWHFSHALRYIRFLSNSTFGTQHIKSGVNWSRATIYLPFNTSWLLIRGSSSL